MSNVSILQDLVKSRAVFLFFHKGILPKTTLKGLETFISAYNINMKKSGYNFKFGYFLDEVVDKDNNFMGNKVYLTLNEVGNLKKLKDIEILGMLNEYLFHLIGIYTLEWEKQNG